MKNNALTDSPWNDHRLSPAERYRMKYRTSTEFAINERMRRQVNKAKKRDGIADVIRRAIKNSRSSPKVERELGYSITELKTHIERQFTRRMTWDAYMKGKIHIDHIIPQKSFDLSIDSEWVACWSMTNLRPMWARDNLMKGGRIENLL